MKNTEETQQDIKKDLESSSYSSPAQNIIFSLPSSFDRNKSRLYSKMRKKLLTCFSTGEYEALKKEMVDRRLSSNDIVEFLEKEGREILSKAVAIITSNKPLAFLVEIIPQQILKKVLSYNDYSVITNFLCVESAMENHGRATSESQKAQFEKFKLLLGVDAREISSFINKHINEEFMTNAIKENYLKALEEFNKESTLNKNMKF